MPLTRRAPRRVVVSGERDDQRLADVFQAFERLGVGPGWRVAHGAARGVDNTADALARELGAEVETYPVLDVEWDEHGPLAGALRNTAMLEAEKPDLVLAFPGPRSRGTLDLIRKARRAGIEVQVCWRGLPNRGGEFEV